jgi:hypothetical protein
VFAQMSGVGLKTRSSIVMVKIVPLPCIKHATALLLSLLVRGIVENVNHKRDQHESAVNSVRRVTVRLRRRTIKDGHMLFVLYTFRK